MNKISKFVKIINIYINMKRIVLTEEEKEDILAKYTEADDKILVYLRRNFPIIDIQKDLQEFFGKYRIMVDDKAYSVRNNFSALVNLIDLEIRDIFPDVDDKKRRQTIKKFVKYFED